MKSIAFINRTPLYQNTSILSPIFFHGMAGCCGVLIPTAVARAKVIRGVQLLPAWGRSCLFHSTLTILCVCLDNELVAMLHASDIVTDF